MYQAKSVETTCAALSCSLYSVRKDRNPLLVVANVLQSFQASFAHFSERGGDQVFCQFSLHPLQRLVKEELLFDARMLRRHGVVTSPHDRDVVADRLDL